MSDFLNLLYFLVPLIIASMVPLAIVALGGLFSESTGVINIALEGIMIMGAFVGIVIMRLLVLNENVTIGLQWIAALVLLIGAIFGALYAALHAFAAINMKSNQIISATALNLFVPAISVFVARFYFGTSNLNLGGNYLVRSVPVLSNIPVLGDCSLPTSFCQCTSVLVSLP